MRIALIMAGLTVVGFGAWLRGAAQATQKPPAVPTPVQTAAVPAIDPSNEEINERLTKQILDRIAGHENEPAERVFKNIQWFKGTPARRLILIMNVGYSQGLGVNCTHCHAEQDFSSDEKRPKRAARDMAAMHREINNQLQQMRNLDPKPNHFIDCSTCHRGAVDPMASER